MKKKDKAGPDAILSPVYHIAKIARSLERLEDAFSLFINAQHGSDEDRALIVKHLKEQFEAFQERT